MISKKVKSRIIILANIELSATVVIFFILKSLEENKVYFFSPSEIYDKPNISFLTVKYVDVLPQGISSETIEFPLRYAVYL